MRTSVRSIYSGKVVRPCGYAGGGSGWHCGGRLCRSRSRCNDPARGRRPRSEGRVELAARPAPAGWPPPLGGTGSVRKAPEELKVTVDRTAAGRGERDAPGAWGAAAEARA